MTLWRNGDIHGLKDGLEPTEVAMSPLRVLLVNDDLIGLQSAYGKLAGDRRIDIVGRAHSGPDAYRKMRELEPDVVLLELDVSGEVAFRMFGSEMPRRVTGIALRDLFFRVNVGEVVAGSAASEGFGDCSLPLIARLFTVDERGASTIREGETFPQFDHRCSERESEVAPGID